MKPATLKQQNTLRDSFLDAMSRVPTAVSVVTTSGRAGLKGATVSALSSVSADGPKPLLLVCLHRDGRLGKDVLANGSFGVNVLSDKQSWVSDIFAGRLGLSHEQRFSAVDWRPMHNGAPAFAGASVRLACDVHSSERVGTHDVIFGTVTNIDHSTTGLPLVYACRNYARPMPLSGMESDLKCA